MRTQSEPSILWREGMFLCPQHLQGLSREMQSRIHAAENIGQVGSFGLLSWDIDEVALERDAFRLASAEVVFPDGTLVRFPETGTIEQRDFSQAFEGSTLDIFLGIPARQSGVPELGETTDIRARYHAETVKFFDENLKEEPRDLEVRVMHGRLFFGDEDRSGFESVPLARLIRKGKPVAISALSPDFVPPILACGASPALFGKLAALAEEVRAQARDLAARIPNTTGLSSVEKGADIAGFIKLQAVNQCVAILDQYARLPSLHPFAAYMGIVQAVGNLAIFGEDRVVPKLAGYDHGNLGECFETLMETVQSLIPAEVSVPYDTTQFTADPMREGFFQAEIPADWLERNPLIFLAVEIAKPADEAVSLVTTGVKLLAESDLERVLQGVVPGIELEYVRTPPMAFPKRPDLHFFKICTEGNSRDGWLKIAEANMAVLLTALAGVDTKFHIYVELRS